MSILENRIVERGSSETQSGVWGPVYATVFGAWFAPWPAAVWAAWALSSYGSAGVIAPAVCTGLLTMGLHFFPLAYLLRNPIW